MAKSDVGTVSDWDSVVNVEGVCWDLFLSKWDRIVLHV